MLLGAYSRCGCGGVCQVRAGDEIEGERAYEKGNCYLGGVYDVHRRRQEDG